ncbi:MAG: met regulon transcriptional regulator MetJ [Mizugakiibacter sp.]|uniref:met regulon transcriptional regulator MetJ n=1 Tax=Mizugakiibacter sp. TaxID=1972610 RepID=UPI00320C3B4E
MAAVRYIKPYIEHGAKAGAVKKITVSVPLHVLQLLSDERTRRQVNNLRHATNSDLLCEAFLHAFTGQPLPTDEELRRTMAMTKKAAKKPAAKKAAKKSTAKKAVRKTVKAKATTARKTSAAKKPARKKAAAKKTAKKRTVRKSAAAKVSRATKAAKK